MNQHTILFFLTVLTGWGSHAHAEVADLIPVGGFITNADSKEPLNGEYAMSFGLYDEKDASAVPLWHEDSIPVVIEEGFFSVYLGPFAIEDIIGTEALWLGIRIGQDDEMERIQIGAVPFAFEAQVCHEVRDAYCEAGTFLRGWDNGEAVCEPILKRTVLVAPVGDGSDARANGDALIRALDAVDDASTEHPYLIKIEPGQYLLENEAGESQSLVMKPWVDIEGSGRNTTVIQSKGFDDREFGTVVLADYSELRNVTVENIGNSAAFAIALLAVSITSTNAQVANAVLKGKDATNCRTVYVRYGNIHLENVTIDARCSNYTYGMFLSNAELVMLEDIDIKAEPTNEFTDRSCGILLDATRTTITDSRIESSTQSSGEALGIRSMNTNTNISSELLVMNTTISTKGETSSTPFIEIIKTNTNGQKITIQNSVLTADGSTPTAVRTQWDEENTSNLTSGTTVIDVVGSKISSDGIIAAAEATSDIHFVSALLKGNMIDNGDRVTCTAVTDRYYTFHADTCPGTD